MDSVTNIAVAEPLPASEISWSAVIAGALVAGVVSLCLFMLGSGLGLAAAPWFSAPSAVKITVHVVIWLVSAQWAASAFGGYVAGRLRVRWASLHPGEVFFRDTAHGFLSWIVATLLVAGFAAVAAPAIAHNNMRAESMAMRAQGPGDSGPFAYYVDGLYRGATAPDNGDVKAETNRIFMTDVKNGAFPDADRAYLGQLVAARTGVAPADATMRVNSAIAGIDADKEKARKAGMTFSFASFLSMLVGAFIASVAAVLGGQQRDRHR